MTLKVIGAGFGRTGTASMKQALEILGFGPCHHMREVLANPEQKELWRLVVNGKVSDWDALLAGYNATVDWPAAYFWRELSEYYPDKEIGAVSNDETAIFFRKRTGSFEPAGHWNYANDVDAINEKLVEAGANIVDDIENKPWGMRQFTIKDLDGNIFYIHHDLSENQP